MSREPNHQELLGTEQDHQLFQPVKVLAPTPKPAILLPQITQDRYASHPEKGRNKLTHITFSGGPFLTNPGTTPITILAVDSDHGLSFARVLPGRKLGPWSEFPFLYRFTVLLNSGGSNSPWSEFWSEFPHFMGMGVVAAPSIFDHTMFS